MKEARDIAARFEHKPPLLAGLALGLLKSTDLDCIDLAEQWTREAAAKEPSWQTDALSAQILGIRNQWAEALSHAKTLVDAAATVDDAQSMATDFLINAAAAGHAGQALVLLNSSPGAARLEPLIVGLQLFLGEAPAAAKEILEIGQDVVERIRKRKASITALQNLDNSSPQQLRHR